MSGTKRETVATGLIIGGQPLNFTYDSIGRDPGVNTGTFWFSSLHRSLNIKTTLVNFILNINANRGDGHIVSFELKNGVYTPSSTSNDTLGTVSGGYRFTETASQTIETYDSTGRLQTLADAKGNTLSYAYSDAATPLAIAPAAGYLTQVTDNSGRSIRFEYTLPAGANAATDGRISKIVDPATNAIVVGYDVVGNLNSLTWSDGKTKNYLYENSLYPWALTGVVDENQTRYATFGYDAAGHAISTEHAGGVDKFSISYSGTPPQQTVRDVVVNDPYYGSLVYSYHEVQSSSPSYTVTLPNGVGSVGSIDSSRSFPLLAGMSQPPGSGCAASNNASTFDAQGNLLSQDNFEGVRSCYVYDSKNQETTRVEGLANTVDCATVLSSSATLPANARKTTTTYHSDWRMPTVITAPGSITTNIHQGQADPFNGNQMANCTPAANLPNGKPLPLVCKQVTQATLSSGALDSTVADTVTQYTYDTNGRVLTVKDSLNRTTSYTYYTDLAFTGVDANAVGHTVGDLQTITNPAGFVTTFNSYDKTGRILKTTDPKGIVTDMTYTPRGWVNTVTTTAPGQTARTTTYTYDFVGQLTGVANPDGSSLAYTYDAAHRLTGATDAKGNSVTYTLDNMGNRIKEDVKDPSGVLQRSIDRSFDALNRLQQVSGAVQ